MTKSASPTVAFDAAGTTAQAERLAIRLEQGARALADFARSLTDTEWQSPLPGDGRTVGVIVHHVASVYPLEIQLAQTLAGGQPITGVTASDVNVMNANHASENRAVTKHAAVELLERNSAAAAAAIRAFSDVELAQPSGVVVRRRAPYMPVRSGGPCRPA